MAIPKKHPCLYPSHITDTYRIVFLFVIIKKTFLLIEHVILAPAQYFINQLFVFGKLFQFRQRNDQLCRIVHINRISSVMIVHRHTIFLKESFQIVFQSFFQMFMKRTIPTNGLVGMDTLQIISRVKIINPLMKRKRAVWPGAITLLVFTCERNCFLGFFQ